jgi:dTDP-4-dehydrorhamnose reductase
MRVRKPLELWGGLEATIVRIGDRFRDQIAETGHSERIEDLDRIAALGIRTLRYPFLWEAISPDRPDEARWEWHDERAERLRALGIRPIAGLVHHGSGPAYTSLVDPSFPELLAQHAANVARRYPWIDLYTPVNEPLTTARFSALYGHWYPHARTDALFFRALVNECRATILAMREIRKITPAAKLVQTEDIGRVFSTPALAYQAEFENDRRWLSFDLLFGRFTRRHPWWSVLVASGIAERDLDEIADGGVMPDIVGLNTYLTSERYLDQRLARYPEHLWGGNGRNIYADAEAVRVRSLEGLVGPEQRIREVWDRYGAPIAVTEVHHGCTRDEQLRWLVEVWRAAEALRQAGADIRAVTIWSLFGAVDWNSLLTREAGLYEPGPFDVRGPSPRPTALAHAAASLAKQGRFEHPVLDTAGWWRRDTRFYKPGSAAIARDPDPARPVLVLGDGGPVTDAVARVCSVRGLAHTILNPRSSDAVARAFAENPPWAVLDLAALSRTPRLVGDPAEILARRCREANAALMTLTPTGLFGGELGRPALETDAPDPMDAAGHRVLAREMYLRELNPDALVIRTGPLFGPWDSENAVFDLLVALSSGSARIRPDVVSPSYLPDLLHVAIDLLIDGERGIWHLPNAGLATWPEIAETLARQAGLPPPRIRATGAVRNLSLDSVHGRLMPTLDSALDRFLRECEPEWRLATAGLPAAAE